MRKLSPSRYEPIGYINVYLDQIEDIWHILCDFANYVRISSEDYDFDGIDDLKESKLQTLPDLCIVAQRKGTDFNHEPHTIRVSIARYSCTVSRSSDTPEMRGVVEKIREVLKRSQSAVLSFMYEWGGSLGWGLTAFIVTGGLEYNNRFLGIIGGILFVLSACWTAYTIKSARSRHPVKLYCRKDSPSFMQANWEKVALLVVGAVLAALFQALFRWLVK